MECDRTTLKNYSVYMFLRRCSSRRQFLRLPANTSAPEASTMQRGDAWPRTTRGYEADVGLYHIPGERDIYLDAVLSLANPRTYPGCENKAGKVAELWARRKNAEHPVFDRQTGRRLQPFDFCALAFERHGFIAKETKSFIQKLARIKAAHYELDPTEEIRKWYAVISFCIQRANAKILCGDPTPSRRRAPPRSLLAGPHDLALCGS